MRWGNGKTWNREAGVRDINGKAPPYQVIGCLPSFPFVSNLMSRIFLSRVSDLNVSYLPISCLVSIAVLVRQRECLSLSEHRHRFSLRNPPLAGDP